ncbi:MAG TPA: BTAD domain-containing putative transcriptional regulator, partial [Aggregicoccus sp.]|nr:BTAD domain-containing putative transcriptional regulator [Aggregicoccus sp.]
GALALEPDSGPFLDSLGAVYLRRGEAERAAQVLARAAALAPQEPLIHEHLGDALHAVGRLVEAAGAYRRALEALAVLAPEAGEPLPQQTTLERKLKMLSTRAADD